MNTLLSTLSASAPRMLLADIIAGPTIAVWLLQRILLIAVICLILLIGIIILSIILRKK